MYGASEKIMHLKISEIEYTIFSSSPLPYSEITLSNYKNFVHQKDKTKKRVGMGD